MAIPYQANKLIPPSTPTMEPEPDRWAADLKAQQPPPTPRSKVPYQAPTRNIKELMSGRWIPNATPQFDKAAGKNPSYWSDPRRIARYYHAIQALPDDAFIPEWVDKQGIESAYNYLKETRSGPWETWDNVTDDDPLNIVLKDMPVPPPNFMPLWEQEALRKRYEATKETKPGEYTPDPAAREMSGSNMMLESQYKDLPIWKKGAQALVPVIQYGFAGLGGAFMGARFGLGGAVVGATGMLGGTWIASNIQKKIDAGEEVSEQELDFLKKFALLDWAEIQAEKTGGLTQQIWASLFQPEKYGELNEIFGNWENFKAAYDAGALLYESFMSAAEKKPIGWEQDVANQVKLEQALYSKDNFWQNIFKPDAEKFNKTIEELYGEGYSTEDALKIAMGWKQDTRPKEKEDVIVGAIITSNEDIITRLPNGQDATPYFLKLARDKIKKGENANDVYLELSQKFGYWGGMRDLMGSLLLDPLDQVGPATNKILSTTGKITGHPTLTEAFVNTHRSPIENTRLYGQLVRSKTPAEAAQYSAFSRWVAGLDKAGNVKAMTELQGNPFNWLFGLTPKAKASHMLTTFMDGIYNLVAPEKDIKVFTNMIDTISRFSPAQAIQGAEGPTMKISVGGEAVDVNIPGWYMSTEAQLLPTALKDSIQPMKELVDTYNLAEGQRQIVNRIAEYMGKTGEDFVAELHKMKPDEANAMYNKFLITLGDLKAKGDPNAGKLLDTLTKASDTKQLTGAEIQKMANIFFGDKGVPFNAEILKFRILEAIETSMSKWAVDYFGVKPDPALLRLSNVAKKAQSLLLLGLNPGYFFNNAINNLVTMQWDGILHLGYEYKRQKYMEDFGIIPVRYTQGAGAAEYGQIDMGQLSMFGMKSKPVGTEINKASHSHGGFINNANNLMSGKFESIQIFAKWSQATEKWNSQIAIANGISEYMNRAHRVGKGIPKMPDGLKAMLEEITPGLAKRVEKMIERNISKAKIEKTIWGEGGPGTSIRDFLDPDSIQALDHFGILKEVDERLTKATTPDQIYQVFQDVKNKLQDEINNQVVRNMDKITKDVAAKSQIEGPQGVLDIYDTLTQIRVDMFARHFDFMAEVAEAASKKKGIDRSLIYTNGKGEANRNWTIFQNIEGAKTLGILTGLGLDRTKPLYSEAFNLIADGQINWKNFHAQQQKLFAQFEAEAYGLEWGDPRSTELWYKYNEDVNALYIEASIKEMSYQARLDQIFADLYEKQFPGRAAEAEKWRNAVGTQRRRMIQAQALWRTGTIPENLLKWGDLLGKDIKDAIIKLSEGQPIYKFNRQIRDIKNPKFYKEIYTQLVKDLSYESNRTAPGMPEIPEATEIPADAAAALDAEMPPQGQGIPVFITQKMRSDLKDLGYTTEDVSQMTPEDAWQVINNGTRKIEVETEDGQVLFDINTQKQSTTPETTPTAEGIEPAIDEGKRIKQSAGQNLFFDLDDVIDYVKKNFNTEDPEEINSILKEYGLDTQEGINKANEDTINQYVEEPAKDLVRSLLKEGKRPRSSNAYGPGRKGVDWVDRDGNTGFTPLETTTQAGDLFGQQETAPAPKKQVFNNNEQEIWKIVNESKPDLNPIDEAGNMNPDARLNLIKYILKHSVSAKKKMTVGSDGKWTLHWKDVTPDDLRQAIAMEQQAIDAQPSMFGEETPTIETAAPMSDEEITQVNFITNEPITAAPKITPEQQALINAQRNYDRAVQLKEDLEFQMKHLQSLLPKVKVGKEAAERVLLDHLKNIGQSDRFQHVRLVWEGFAADWARNHPGMKPEDWYETFFVGRGGDSENVDAADLSQLRYNTQLIEAAIEKFGTTHNIKEAGFILPDGTLLDLSGRSQASGYRRVGTRYMVEKGRDYLSDQRSLDHRETISLMPYSKEKSLYEDRLAHFMAETGAIRIDANSQIVDAASKLTREQINVIKSYFDEYTHFDITDPKTGQLIESINPNNRNEFNAAIQKINDRFKQTPRQQEFDELYQEIQMSLFHDDVLQGLKPNALIDGKNWKVNLEGTKIRFENAKTEMTTALQNDGYYGSRLDDILKALDRGEVTYYEIDPNNVGEQGPVRKYVFFQSDPESLQHTARGGWSWLRMLANEYIQAKYAMDVDQYMTNRGLSEYNYKHMREYFNELEAKGLFKGEKQEFLYQDANGKQTKPKPIVITEQMENYARMLLRSTDKEILSAIYLANTRDEKIQIFAAMNKQDPVRAKQIYDLAMENKSFYLWQEETGSKWYYYQSENIISTKMPDNMKSNSLIALLKNNVKPEELETLGINEWLSGQKGSVSKQEVLDYIRANMLEIEETVLGDGETKFNSYLLRGGSKIRNLLIRLPATTDEYFMTWKQITPESKTQMSGYYKKYNPSVVEEDQGRWAWHWNEDNQVISPSFPDASYKQEARNNWLDGYYEELIKNNSPDFKKSHWDQPNVLAHTRFQEFIDTDGKRVLLIDEIQSDWHQQGKDHGYQIDLSNNEKALEEEANRIGWQVQENADGTFVLVDLMGEWIKENASATRLEALKNGLLPMNMPGNIPDAPFKTTWPELIIKRMIRWAAENGYDRVAWTPGEIQIDRYDLAKQVHHISSNRKDDGTYRITAISLDKSYAVIDQSFKPEQLPEVVGKELANKIISNEDSMGYWEGEDLKIGGAGMRKFYDEAIPNKTKKYIKKWNSELKEITLPTETKVRRVYQVITDDTYQNVPQRYWDIVAEFEFEDEAHGYMQTHKEPLHVITVDNPIQITQKVPAFDVTPEMREAVMTQGQSLFQQKRGSTRWIDDGLAVMHLFENADISTIVHETVHVYTPQMSQAHSDLIRTWLKNEYKMDLPEDWHLDPVNYREASETLAKGFERYLAEGKAPIPSLNEVFAAFKKWMLEIYKKITGSDIDIKLDANVKKVFDEWMAGDKLEELKNASAKPPLDWAEYIKLKDTMNEERLIIKAGTINGKKVDPAYMEVIKRNYAKHKAIIDELDKLYDKPVMRPGFEAEMAASQVEKPVTDLPGEEALRGFGYSDEEIVEIANRPVVETEDWNMTVDQFVEQSRLKKDPKQYSKKDEEFARTVHKIMVRNRVQRGLEVPPEVLKDYPELERIASGTKRMGDTYVEPEVKAPEVKAPDLALKGVEDFTKGMAKDKKTTAITKLKDLLNTNGDITRVHEFVESIIYNGGEVVKIDNKRRLTRVKGEGQNTFFEETMIGRDAMNYAEYLMGKNKKYFDNLYTELVGLTKIKNIPGESLTDYPELQVKPLPDPSPQENMFSGKKPRQEGFFDATGEDLPLLSGTAQRAQADIFAPQEVAPQDALFDMRQQLPTIEGKRAEGGAEGTPLFGEQPAPSPETSKVYITGGNEEGWKVYTPGELGLSKNEIVHGIEPTLEKARDLQRKITSETIAKQTQDSIIESGGIDATQSETGRTGTGLPEPGRTGTGVQSGRTDSRRSRDASGRLIIARSERTKAGNTGLVPQNVLEHLAPHQADGVAKAIEAFQSDVPNKRGFILADGTGAGKTRQELAIAKTYADQGRPVVIITKAEVIKADWKKGTFAGSFKNDASTMGMELILSPYAPGFVEPGNIYLSTYERMDGFYWANGIHDAVVIFDEAHALKNADSKRAQQGMDIAGVAHAVVYASATPADKPQHIDYMARANIFEGKSREAAYRSLGLTERTIKVGKGRNQREITIWVVDSSVGSTEVYRRMGQLFDRMTENGNMIKREISMDGIPVRFHKLPIDAAGKAILQKIEDAFSDGGSLNGLKKALVLMHQRRQQEPMKIPVVKNMVKQELDAGRQVVVFLSRVNDSDVIKRMKVGRGEFATIIEEVIHSSEGTVKTLKKELEAMGIKDIAELHGGSKVAAPESMDKFQTGKARVMLATLESGGTGINLDDITGDAPRTIIFMTAPFSAVENIQGAGRVWRMTTKSQPKIIYLFGDTPTDQWNAAIIAEKMKMLGATVEGEVRKLDIPEDIDMDLYLRNLQEDYGNEPKDPATYKTPLEGAAYDRGFTIPKRGELSQEGVTKPTRTIALDPEQNQYEFEYKIVELDDLITSHTDALGEDPRYPQELQPRERDRAASQAQIDDIAKRLVPLSYILDQHATDRGTPTIGKGNMIVESGNGRTIALRRARAAYPEKFKAYQDAVKTAAAEYGLSTEGFENPVLVRERITEDIDLEKFTAVSNKKSSADLSDYEMAVQDLKFVSDEMLAKLKVAEGETVTDALMKDSNQDVVRDFIKNVPVNEYNKFMTDEGELSNTGAARMTYAMMLKVFPDEAGKRLLKVITDNSDEGIINLHNVLLKTMGELAMLESKARSGVIPADLAIAEDLTKAIDTYMRLKQQNVSPIDYVKQTSIFEKELNEFQGALLLFINANKRSEAKLRRMVSAYVKSAVSQDAPGQDLLFGAPLTKGEILDGIAKTLGRETDFASTTRAEEITTPTVRTTGEVVDSTIEQPAEQPAARPQPDEPVARPQPEPIKETEQPAVGAPFGTADQVLPPPYDEMLYEGWLKDIMPALEDAQNKMMSADIPDKTSLGSQLTKDQQKELRKYLGNVYSELTSTKMAAIQYSMGKRDFALHDYTKRTGADNILGGFFPYQFWYTRSALNWFLRLATNPGILADYYRIMTFGQQSEDKEGYPNRLKGKIGIPVPFLPDWMGKNIYIDPFKQIFPFRQLTAPFRQMQDEANMLNKKTMGIIQQQLEDGEITDAQAEEAVKQKSGEVWDAAMKDVRASSQLEFEKPLDYATALISPSLPLSLALNLSPWGDKKKISQLPVTRLIQSVTSMLGIGGPRGLNIEAPFRRGFGLDEVDQYETYRINRELSNMVADGLLDPQVAIREMVDGKGPNYEAAKVRVAKQMNPRTFFSSVGLDFFPEGEQEMRSIAVEYGNALDAYFEGGDKQALTKFWDEFPEYEARIASNNTEDPEKMLRTFLRSRIWQNFNNMNSYEKQQAIDALGQTFELSFLNKDTRNYNDISTETYASWAKTLGAEMPESYEDATEIPGVKIPEEVNNLLNTYLQERDQMFPGISDTLSKLYSLDVDSQSIMRKNTPIIEEYQNWRNKFIANNPAVAEYLTGEQSELYGLPPQIQVAVYQYRDQVNDYFPDIYKKQEEYFDIANSTQKKNYLKQHPELAAYWDFRREYAAAYPQAAPYILSDESLAKYILGEDRSPQTQEVQLPDEKNLDPALLRLLGSYFYGGRELSSGARAELTRLWKAAGSPAGSMENWLNAYVWPNLK